MSGAVGTFTSCTFTSNTAQTSTTVPSGTCATVMGGAVYSTSSIVSFTGCTFTSNMAQGGQGGAGAANAAVSGTAGSGGTGGIGEGGGVFATAGVSESLTGCTFISDQALGGQGGAGGANTGNGGHGGSGGSGGQAYGGALLVNSGPVTIMTTTFSSCIATGGTGGRGGDNDNMINYTPASAPGAAGTGGAAQGGGLVVLGTGTATVLDTTFSLDTATGGTGGQGANDDEASDPIKGVGGGGGGTGEGGAVGADGNSVTITNTTLSGDTAEGGSGGTGGKLPNATPAAVGAQGGANVGEGGGLLLFAGTATVSDSTFNNVYASANWGGGIAILAGTATVNNTILGTSTGGDIIVATGGTLAGGYNLFADTTYATTALTNTVYGTPQLGALANNGGPTQTIALLAGSPAIAAGSVALIPSGVTTDQRASIPFTGTVTPGSTTVTNIVGTAGLAPGMPVTFGGVQFGTISTTVFSGTLSTTLAVVTNVSSTTGLFLGEAVTGAVGVVPAGTTIQGIGVGTITLSAHPTAAGAESLTGVTMTLSAPATAGPTSVNWVAIPPRAHGTTVVDIGAYEYTDPPTPLDPLATYYTVTDTSSTRQRHGLVAVRHRPGQRQHQHPRQRDRVRPDGLRHAPDDRPGQHAPAQ